MNAAEITREERAEIRLNRYRRRAAEQRHRALVRKESGGKRRDVFGGKSKRPTYSDRVGTHKDQVGDLELRARRRKVVTKRRKTIARASRQRNRR